jgi:hypothetical protein
MQFADLTGWLTIENSLDVGYRNARVILVDDVVIETPPVPLYPILPQCLWYMTLRIYPFCIPVSNPVPEHLFFYMCVYL